MTLDALATVARAHYPRGAVSVERRGMGYVVSVHDGPPPTARGVPWLVVARRYRLLVAEAASLVADDLRGRAT